MDVIEVSVAHAIKRRLLVEHLCVGMVVVELDRPWMGTPFLYEGFAIDSDSTLRVLEQYCQYVYIDQRCLPRGFDRALLLPKNTSDGDDGSLQLKAGLQSTSSYYSKSTQFREKAVTASDVTADLTRALERAFQSSPLSHTWDARTALSSVLPAVESLAANTNAMAYLSHLKHQRIGSYHHAINSAAWAIALGRQLCLPKLPLQDLALGVLLCDIGHLDIADEILNKTSPLDNIEKELMHAHVDHSVGRLQLCKGISAASLEIVKNHHERESGSGYPLGLVSKDISLLAKIAAIVDSYTAMVSSRAHRAALSSSEAIDSLYQQRGSELHAGLVDEFIQLVGLYTVGSLVELNNGCVAVVVRASVSHPLRPMVMTLLNSDKLPLLNMDSVDLALLCNNKPSLQIIKQLPSGSYDIDPDEFYLMAGAHNAD